MQRLFSSLRMLNVPMLWTTQKANLVMSSINDIQNTLSKKRLLSPSLPIVNLVNTFKVKGRLKRRCKHCYFVRRQERLYIICPVHPRHKQMQMIPKPHNTWILTHASQSPIRPW